ncbi:(deoxy)nucleoside triphosphate pyrophosphohydrolase [Desulforhopalus sp. 52FAK]
MLDVTAAIIQRDGQTLAARRKPGSHMEGFWEFPGGKIELGESPEECLQRELKEELGIDSVIGSFFAESCYNYGTKHVRLLCYLVEYNKGSFSLNDHDEIRWLSTDQILSVNWAPADIPIVKKLGKLKR